jgi:GTPase SAR1 family protein/Tfp pilus assembly protein PilP
MSQTRKPRGVRATREGLQKLQQAKAAKRNDKGKPWTYFDVATAAEVDEKTVQRFFRGEAKDRNYAIAITNALNLEITEVVDPKEWNPVEQTAGAINWRDVCGKVLAQQRENQRLRRQATERGFELNVYVPLGLVERKQQQRRRGDVPLEEVYQLTEEVITKEYDNDQFLTEVIESGKSRRIAIIGEPGAGKTTLQEKIAIWLQDNNKGLPICIPLGGLQGKSLEDYLQQIWLKAALGFIEPDASGVEAQAFASLQKQFREGKVWLLLDGVDEMAATSPVKALATIKEQLTDWLVEARVVLTCRLNVWDANVNTILTGFETYRTLEFKREQVEDFIRQWFACAEKLQQYCSDKTDLTPPCPPSPEGTPCPPLPYQGMGEQYSPLLAAGALVRKGQGERFACASESQRGEELIKKLQETGRERIRQLVRNPLRLSLLCQTSYLLPVDEPLPETKAALYERFTRYFYEWKQEQHLDFTEQDELIDELHEALGKLALAGINSAARFRLGRKLARQVMGDRLFKLAERLNWLVLVDREANTDEAVYAFFHPTFQEYFAACAIDDWQKDFLKHVPENPMQGIYRIFESHWKEVILLWLGRENVAKEQKETFIEALVKFEDGWENFYEYQAYFLASAGIAEFDDFSDSNFADEIVEQLIDWSFGYFDGENQRRMKFPESIENGATIALQETDSTKAIKALTRLFQEIQNDSDHFRVAAFILNIDSGNPKATATLTDLLYVQHYREAAASILLDKNPNHPEAKNVFDSQKKKNSQDEINRMKRALEAIKNSQLKARQAVESSNDVQALIHQLRDNVEIKDGSTSVKFTFTAARERLVEIATGSIDVIEALIALLLKHPCEFMYYHVISIFDKILNKNSLVSLVVVLKTHLSEPVCQMDCDSYRYCMELMSYCAQNMTYPDFYQAWHQTSIHERG